MSSHSEPEEGAGPTRSSARKPAETYVERRWYDGRNKVRCVKCYKVVYADRKEAVEAAVLISVRTNMTAYLGKKCGHWHVSRWTKKKRQVPT